MTVVSAIELVERVGADVVMSDPETRRELNTLFRLKSFDSLLDCWEGRPGYTGKTGTERMLNALKGML